MTMTDLDNNDLMIARGKYSTIRGAHEGAKKSLAMLCGQLTSQATHILRHMQPNYDGIPDNIDRQIDGARNTLILMEACAKEIEALARQRAELKPLAWGKA